MHYLASPDAPMDGTIHEIASAPTLALPLAAATYYPTDYEFAQASVAFESGVSFLTIYYVLAPWLATVIAITALLLIVRCLGASLQATAYAGVLLVPLILLLGEAHRSYGNLSLARAFQSKFAFMLFGLPVFVSLSLTFFRRRDAASWLCLLVATVALSGMTTSALVMLPMLAVLLLAAWFATGEYRAGWMRLSAMYGLTQLPTCLLALDYRRYAVAYVGFGSPLNAGFPQTFSGQFGLLGQGAAAPISVAFFAAALLVCLSKPKRNGFVLWWALLGVALYLNPAVAPWLMRHVTSENIYWRLFYMLPFPLVMGIALAQVIDGFLIRWAGRWEGVAALLLCWICVVISPTSVLRKGNGARVGLPGPTLDSAASDALAIAKVAPGGVVLAPMAVAQDMAILSTRHTQIATRADFMANVFRDKPGESARRISASLFVSGEGGRLEDLVQVVHRDKPAVVVMAHNVLSPTVVAVMSDLYLRKAADVGQWAIYESP
jgi:hypothetical protein